MSCSQVPGLVVRGCGFGARQGKWTNMLLEFVSDVNMSVGGKLDVGWCGFQLKIEGCSFLKH